MPIESSSVRLSRVFHSIGEISPKEVLKASSQWVMKALGSEDKATLLLVGETRVGREKIARAFDQMNPKKLQSQDLDIDPPDLAWVKQPLRQQKC